MSSDLSENHSGASEEIIEKSLITSVYFPFKWHAVKKIITPLLAVFMMETEPAFANDMILSCKASSDGLYSSVEDGMQLLEDFGESDFTINEFDNIHSMEQIDGETMIDFIKAIGACKDSKLRTSLDPQELTISLVPCEKNILAFGLTVSRLSGDFSRTVFFDNGRTAKSEGKCSKIQKKF